ncbi:MAG: response regulator transcription factor [Opitutae bacterium]|nr:response regulator transcription factor [Opitutae bacterium]
MSILQIEDDPLWREFCGAALREIAAVERVESAADGASGMALAELLQPTIVLIDLRLPDMDGFEAIAALARLRPAPPKILILSSRNDAVAIFRMRDERVHGFLWKTGDVKTHLAAAVAELAAGRRYFPEEVRRAWAALRAEPSAFFKILSGRELELMPYFARGWDDAEIGRALGLSALTVKSHRQHAMAKVGVHRTPQLIHWAIRAGFGHGEAQPAALH